MDLSAGPVGPSEFALPEGATLHIELSAVARRKAAGGDAADGAVPTGSQQQVPADRASISGHKGLLPPPRPGPSSAMPPVLPAPRSAASSSAVIAANTLVNGAATGSDVTTADMLAPKEAAPRAVSPSIGNKTVTTVDDDEEWTDFTAAGPVPTA